MKLNYRPEIDGLRAIAIFLVFFYHANILLFGGETFSFFKGGYIGVDIFFVISGYLITSIILNEIKQNNNFNLANFYERRARRILPALFFTMIFTLILGFLFLNPNKLVELSKSIIFSEIFFSNFFFWQDGLEYGSEDSFLKPFLHSWSLAVEEQFYLVFPILILITLKINKNLIPHLLVYLLAFSFFLSNLTVLTFPSLSFYSIHARIWELAFGSLLGFIEINKNIKISNFRNYIRIPFQFLAIFLLSYSIFKFNQNTLHPSFNTLAPIICIVIFISALKKGDFITSILSNKIFVWLGLISYSLYLWHFPILSIAGSFNTENFGSLFKFFILFGIICVSILSYLFIEKPFRNREKILKGKFIISISILAIIIFLISLLTINKNGFSERLPEILQKSLSEERPWTLLKDNEGTNCYSRKEKPCEFNNNSNKEIYLIGDSHLAAMSNEIKKLSINKNYKFIDLTNPRCLFLPNFVRVNKDNGKISNFCNLDYQRKVEKYVNNSSTESIFIFGGRFPMYLSGKKFDNQEGGIEPGKVWIEEFQSTRYQESFQSVFKEQILRIANMGKEIILIYPIPETGFDTKSVIYNRIPKIMVNLNKKEFEKQLQISPITTSYEVFKSRTESSFKLLDSIKHKNITRVYPHKFFCNNTIKNRCITHNQKEIFYFDHNHLSNSGTKYIINLIFESIKN